MASSLHSIILLYEPCVTSQYFSTLFPKRYDFRKNYFEHETCFFFIFLTNSVWNISCLRRIPRGNSFHSSRGLLPTVARRCVWSRSRKNGGDTGPRWAAPPQEKKSKFASVFTRSICHSCQILFKPERPRHALEKNTQVQNFTKVRPEGAEFSLRTHRQTDRQTDI
jgi:hypothetical protein